ncbi:hypothetical protein JW978_00965 [Candidatus Dojkabacteria bacterium]|nr:hypothetical protein [Candidatus Dojkabacteria bacterium]
MEKGKKIEIIKYFVLFAALAVSIAVIVLIKPTLSSDFAGTKRVELNFSTDVDLDQVVDLTKNIGGYDRIEKINSSQVIVDFVDLDTDNESITNRYSELEGFVNTQIKENNLVAKNYTGIKYFVGFALPMYLIFQYILLNNIEKSRNRYALLFAFLVQNVIEILVFVSILFNLSRLFPLTNEIISLFLTLSVGRLLVDMLLLFKINLAAKAHSQDDFPKFIREFILKYDRNFVIVGLFSIIIFMPLVLVSNDISAAVILLLSFLGLNTLVETFMFADLIDIFYFSIRKIPVIKDLKWSRK